LGRRHRLDIVADILRVADNGVQKTQLVYLTNINFTLLKRYQKILTEKGFIDSKNGQIFTTNEGRNFLSKYEELMMNWAMLSARKSSKYSEDDESLIEVIDQTE
jgi:predicted transcriptional regulator